jgi:hypothetical protein
LKTKFPSGEVTLHGCITERSKTYASPQKRNDTDIIGLKRNKKIQETNKRQRESSGDTDFWKKVIRGTRKNLSEVH